MEFRAIECATSDEIHEDVFGNKARRQSKGVRFVVATGEQCHLNPALSQSTISVVWNDGGGRTLFVD